MTETSDKTKEKKNREFPPYQCDLRQTGCNINAYNCIVLGSIEYSTRFWDSGFPQSKICGRAAIAL